MIRYAVQWAVIAMAKINKHKMASKYRSRAQWHDKYLPLTLNNQLASRKSPKSVEQMLKLLNFAIKQYKKQYGGQNTRI